MRRSGGSPLFVFDEKTKQCIGVQLPPDCAAEHESGIGGISEDFGLPSREELVAKQMVGVDVRRASKIPANYKYISKNWQAFMLMTSYKKEHSNFDELYSNRKDYELDLTKIDCGGPDNTPEEVSGSWSDEDFGIAVGGQNNMTSLYEIAKAVDRLDIAVFSYDAQTHQLYQPSLCIYIASRIPEELQEHFVNSDTHNWNLVRESDKSGIKQLIPRAWYMSLKPRLITAEQMVKRETAFPLLYWLNPMNQRDHDSGWWTVEELREWHKGRGPILKAHVEQAQ